MVFVRDAGKMIASDLAVLTGLFGLPPAEGRLVPGLLSGVKP